MSFLCNKNRMKGFCTTFYNNFFQREGKCRKLALIARSQMTRFITYS
jgi:hypothetical protein